MLFTDGEEEVLVRFRHRTGVPTNVSFVEKLIDEMRNAGVTTGYLFCSPGLSGNAARLAQSAGIRSHSIETMTDWVNDTLAGDYTGPSGDILTKLNEFETFSRELNYALPSGRQNTGRSRRHKRRGRRWW